MHPTHWNLARWNCHKAPVPTVRLLVSYSHVVKILPRPTGTFICKTISERIHNHLRTYTKSSPNIYKTIWVHIQNHLSTYTKSSQYIQNHLRTYVKSSPNIHNITSEHKLSTNIYKIISEHIQYHLRIYTISPSNIYYLQTYTKSSPNIYNTIERHTLKIFYGFIFPHLTKWQIHLSF